MAQYLVLVGAAAILFGISLYIRDIFRGTTKPNLVTWILWAAAPIIASIAAFSNGVGWLTALPTFMVGFGPVLVVIAALIKRNAAWQLTKFDYLCGLLSIAALILWLITEEPEIAIIFAIMSDGLAALPTLKKSWQFPETESGIVYVVALFNILTTGAALHSFNFSEIAFPMYNTLINAALTIAVYRKQLSRA